MGISNRKANTGADFVCTVPESEFAYTEKWGVFSELNWIYA